MECSLGEQRLAMKTETEKTTILFILAGLFCVLSTVAIYLTLKPSSAESQSSQIIIFPHPENASQEVLMIYYDRIREHTFKGVNQKIDEKTQTIINDLEAMGFRTRQEIQSERDELIGLSTVTNSSKH